MGERKIYELGHKDLRGNPKTQVSLDWTRTGTETSPGSGQVFENIFGSGLIRDKDFHPVRVGVFFTGVSYISSENFKKKKVELNGKHASRVVFPTWTVSSASIGH